MASDDRGQGIPIDEQSSFEQRMGDITSMQGLLGRQSEEAASAFQRGILATEQGRDVSERAGFYAGGQAQAASEAGRVGAERVAQIGQSFAQQLAQQHLAQTQKQFEFEQGQVKLDTEKTRLETEQRAGMLKQTQDNIQKISDQNFTEVGKFRQLMDLASQQGAHPEERMEYIKEAWDHYHHGGLGGVDTLVWWWLRKNPEHLEMLRELGPVERFDNDGQESQRMGTRIA